MNKKEKKKKEGEGKGNGKGRERKKSHNDSNKRISKENDAEHNYSPPADQPMPSEIPLISGINCIYTQFESFMRCM